MERKRSQVNALVRTFASMTDNHLSSSIAHDSVGWLSMAFDLCAALQYYHGQIASGYRPGMGSDGSGELSELSRMCGPHVRRWLSRRTPEQLRGMIALTYAYGTACEGRRENIAA